MIDLSTSYLGLKLKNPIVVASSGISNSLEKIKQLEENGAAAIVLKSLFEEQILAESAHNIEKDLTYGSEVNEYISGYIKENSLGAYIQHIKDAKAAVDIPIIASINCVDEKEWPTWAAKFEQAGADAIEVNISVLPSDHERSAEEAEEILFKISEKVRESVKIPVAIKISPYSASLANMVKKLSWTRNVDGIVLFNRFYNPDINIETMKLGSDHVFSTPADNANTLRWVAILSQIIDEKVDLIATTGIHDGESIIKQLLAGAAGVQIASAIYQNGPEIIQSMLRVMEDWMERKNYKNINQFKGIMAFEKDKNTIAFERIQFMKHFGGIE
jgi:dihydroorotate dehydrogenase (fumarate)